MQYKDEHNGHYCLYHWKQDPPIWCLNLFSLPLRAKQHASSRTALVKILARLGYQENVEQIKISNHHCIQSAPEYLCSLSHTKDGWAVGLIAMADKYLGVGVDLEFKNRTFKEETRKLFVNDSDTYSNLLQLWCYKESAFKAIAPLLNDSILNKVFVLKDIFIRGHDFGLITNGKVLGHIHSDIIVCEELEFIITSAYLVKPLCFESNRNN